tara:strand:- start:854 stop:991 length:138 start_codon:yes stop_codon:yes gene_type:complete
MGRSIRSLEALKSLNEFRGAVVDNADTRARKHQRTKEEEDKIVKR